MLILIYYILELISCEPIKFSSCYNMHNEIYVQWTFLDMLIGNDIPGIESDIQVLL
jgi:hypothetical protein